MDTKQTVIGVFKSKEQAVKAADELARSGYGKEHIDVSAHGTDLEEHRHESTNTFFTNLFGRHPDAKDHYEVARRGTVVTVHTDKMENAKKAATILDKHGALNVGDEAKAYHAKPTTGHTGKATDTKDHTTKTAKGETIPVIEENLEVGKKEVTTGGVKVHSRILEKPVEKKLRLREEMVDVKREPVNREATKADLEGFREGSMTIKEKAEKPVVNKEARVVEEVHVDKKSKKRSETLRDSVRKTEVEVDKIDPKKEKRHS